MRSLTGYGGCAAKAAPALVDLITGFIADESKAPENILAGLKPFDDAAVYELDEERALVASVDFFPPLVDDPNDYGHIAAVNAVSDIYAMGAEVAFALTISGFPKHLPNAQVVAINRAAAAVVRECGGHILGGHSIHCSEPVFGLCVLGFAHPRRIWRKGGAQPGDVLLLSKPVGTGVLLAQHQRDGVAEAVSTMRVTNLAAAHALRESAHPPRAVTDVTGYGLIGHSLEIAERSGVRLHIHSSAVPLIKRALSAARAGVCTSADSTLQAQERVQRQGDLDPARTQLLFDPQTAGGLLAAVHPDAQTELIERGFAAIGRVSAGSPTVIIEP